MKRRGVVLDRDGTIIDFYRDFEHGTVVSAFHPSQLRFLPGAITGLRMLADAGLVLAIATNQPGAAKGQVPWSAIERTNAALVERLAKEGIAVAAFEVCPHHEEGGPGGDPALAVACACRKPLPGMLLRIAAALELDPAASWMVGDGRPDVEAARSAGFRAALLVDTQRCELCPLRDACAPPAWAPELVAGRLDELAPALIAAADRPLA